MQAPYAPYKRSAAALAWVLAALWAPVGAHAELGVDELVEKLQATPATPSAPRTPLTRSSRNLLVEDADPPADNPPAPIPAAAPPSVSLVIQFDLNSARIRTQSLPQLDRLAQALQDKRLVSARFVVQGHTDRTGSAEWNDRLSRERAEAVRGHLIPQRVAPERLQVAGMGWRQLLPGLPPDSPEHRRVVVERLP